MCILKIKSSKASILLEVLFAIVILSISVTLIIQSMSSSLKAIVYNSQYMKALLFSENAIVNVLQQKDASTISDNNIKYDQNVFEGYEYKVAANAADSKGTTDLKNILITTTWGLEHKQKRFLLETYFFNPPQDQDAQNE